MIKTTSSSATQTIWRELTDTRSTVEPSNTTTGMVFEAAGQPLRPEQLPTPTPRAGEVLVRVTCCTICGSDLHTYKGNRSTPVPTILGHEIIGEIEAVGGTVFDFDGDVLKPGDRITWSVAASCGGCFFCDHDIPQKCDSLFKYGHEKIRPEHALSGGLAERCLLAPGTAVVKLPHELPDVVACPANCATATVAAALRTGHLVAGETVVIQGMGALGLTATAMARSLGAKHVIGCDSNNDRLQLGHAFGLTAAFNVATESESLAKTIKELTENRGADLVVELSGAASAIEQGVRLLRTGGRYVLVGSVSPGRDVALNPEMVVRRMLTVHGVHNYTPVDLKSAVQFLTRNYRDYPFEQLVSGTWPLDQAEAAFSHAIAHRALRVAVVPTH